MGKDIRTISDCNVRPEILGLELLLSPFTQFNSSQRSNMFSSNISQALVIDGCEPPRIGSGYEQMFGDYSFDTTKRKSDGQLFDVIPKFEVGFGSSHITDNPKKTVVLITDEGVDCIEISSYTQLYNGFGYKNNISPNMMFLNSESGSFIDKDMEFTKPPNHKDGMYCLGVNANIVFMSMPQVTQDAIVLSESFAKKCSHPGIYTIKIFLDESSLPINLYGNETEPKLFPDIGEQVNDDGILMAIRNKDEESFADLIESSLNRVQISTDNLIKAPLGSTVLDVQVYSSQVAMRKLSNNPGIMGQLVKYQQQHYTYYRKVIDCYNRLKQEGYTKFTPRFNDLVTRCMCLKKVVGSEKKVNLIDKRVPVDYFVLEITYSFPRVVSKGFKYAGRGGDKGVVSDIWPDEHMPLDQQGLRADMIVSPESMPNRLNPSQSYEQFYNRLCTLIVDRYRRGELGNNKQAYEYILELLTDIRPEYGRQIREYCSNEAKREDLMNDIMNDGLYLIIPPFCNNITEENVLMLASKYGYVESPVTYSYKTSDGSLTTETTISPACIGSKYVYLLSKIPSMQASALSVSYINQFGIPTKAKSKSIKMQHLYGSTPLRFGEDEISMLIMGMTPESVARFLGIRANCIQATETMIEKLLTTRSPSAIKNIGVSTDYMVKNSIPAKLLSHYFGIIGYDIGEHSIGRCK
jgi:DNA-directed RNA polymerase beta subunit